LRFCHSLYGGPISDVLPEIKTFVTQTSPNELVILDIHNVTGLDGKANTSSSEQAHEALITTLRQQFSTDGSCATVSTCLLVSSMFNVQNTMNQILTTPGRVIVLDADSNVIDWDQSANGNNPVLWNEQTVDTFFEGVDGFDTLHEDLVNDLNCRCNAGLQVATANQQENCVVEHLLDQRACASSASSSPPDVSQHPDELFPYGINISPDQNLIMTALVEGLFDQGAPNDTDDVALSPLLETGLGDSLGPILAAAAIGSDYIAIGPDIADGPLLQGLANTANPLDLDSLVAQVAANPDLRTGVNWVGTDFWENSDLVPAAIALNAIPPTRFVAHAVDRSGNAYQLGSVSQVPVLVKYDCQQSGGSVATQIDVETVGSTTPALGAFVSPSTDCVDSSTSVKAPLLRVGPIIFAEHS
jgi:hypothetical protein